jgi:hypothetical protein
MAEKRYSPEDQKKLQRDVFADLRAKGVDAVDGKILHPGGIQEGLKDMTKDMGYLKDQSQSQTEANREKMRNSRKEN